MGLATGPRFGTYEVLDLIGVGGMGEIYRARVTREKSSGATFATSWLRAQRDGQGFVLSLPVSTLRSGSAIITVVLNWSAPLGN